MSPRAAEGISIAQKIVTIIFLPFLAYMAVKIDRKVDYAYDTVNRHEQMWAHQNSINTGLYKEISRVENKTDLLDTKFYNLTQRDNSRAVN